MDATRLAKEVFGSNASAYGERFMDVSMYAAVLDKLVTGIPENGHVLEVGCGPGNLSAYLLERLPGIHLTGYDVAPEMVELARVNNPGGVFEVRDVRKIETIPGKYNAVVCGFVLPYLSWDETWHLLSKLVVSLAPGGLLYLSTMEDDYSVSGIRISSAGNRLYQYFYTENDLSGWLRQLGMDVLSCERLASENAGSYATDLVMLAGKK